MSYASIALIDDGEIRVPSEMFTELSLAFMNGKPFACFTDLYGGRHTLKLSRVANISLWDDEALLKWGLNREEKDYG
jgi:hypothetical protein